MKRKLFKLLTGVLLSCTLAGSAVMVQAEENQERNADEFREMFSQHNEFLLTLKF